jgi:lysophospholipase L1-like esterase
MRLAAPLLTLLALAAVAAADTPREHFDKRMALFAEQQATLDPAKRHVVLVGDSLTEAWEQGDRIARFLPALADRVLDRGIGADTTTGLLRRLDASIYALHPSHVVLCMGVNDLAGEADVAPAASRYERIVKEVRGKLPDVPLIVVTVAPARGRFAPRNPLIVALDAHLRRIAQENGCPVIDLYALVADAKGELPGSHATPDGLHWTDVVYELLGKKIVELVAP